MTHQRVSGFPETGADLWGGPWNFNTSSPGNFRASPGNFRGIPGLLLKSTVREVLGKSPGSFRGKWGATFLEGQGSSRSSGEV